MKVIDSIRQMTSEELASKLHYDLGSSNCEDCILMNLDKMKFCSTGFTCTDNITMFLESQVERGDE